jgi:hypothetical protein
MIDYVFVDTYLGRMDGVNYQEPGEHVSADLKGSHCGRFGCEPEMSTMTAGDTGALTAS